MKSVIKIMLLITSSITLASTSRGQDFKKALTEATTPSQNNINFFSPEELTKKWEEFMKDKSWITLAKDVASKKFHRILNKEASWGFNGTIINDKGEKVPAIFCAFDFLDTANIKQGCSMVWTKVGNKSYKSYLIFPSGETKDIERKFGMSEEWFVDEATGTIQKAHSWGKNFIKCVQRGVELPNIETELSKDRSRIKIGGGSVTVSCPGICVAGAIGCSTIAAGVATAIIISGIVAAGTEGIGLPVLIAAGGIGYAILVNCIGASCGACAIMCALGAME
jgi:hypothetical protein